MTQTVEQLLSVEKAAALLSISTKHLYKVIKKGDLPSQKIGRRLKIRECDLKQWVDQQQETSSS